ncbi:MAG: asparagine synthase C-terminal domain-containing protein, partial [Lachnospiraceae bacterium]|nr:asparagine synthase C-terminal domain-containing protein [Lachnospiraceae bacterium]
IRITTDTYLESIPEFVRCMELPVADTAGVAYYIGCRSIKAETKIVFSGEGSDEFFAGYHVHKRYDELGSKEGPGYMGCDGVMTQEEAVRLLDQKTLFPTDVLLKDTFDENCDDLSRMLLADIGLWLEGDILFSANRAAKVCKKKVILPYADKRMFDISAAMPSEYKLKEDIGKYALRCAAERKLSKDTAFRKKVGYLVPVREWFRDRKYRDRISRVVLGDTSRMFFNEEVLRRYWKKYIDGGFTEFRIIFAVYMFVLWYENVYDSK